MASLGVSKTLLAELIGLDQDKLVIASFCAWAIWKVFIVGRTLFDWTFFRTFKRTNRISYLLLEKRVVIFQAKIMIDLCENIKQKPFFSLFSFGRNVVAEIFKPSWLRGRVKVTFSSFFRGRFFFFVRWALRVWTSRRFFRYCNLRRRSCCFFEQRGFFFCEYVITFSDFYWFNETYKEWKNLPRIFGLRRTGRIEKQRNMR